MCIIELHAKFFIPFSHYMEKSNNTQAIWASASGSISIIFPLKNMAFFLTFSFMIGGIECIICACLVTLHIHNIAIASISKLLELVYYVWVRVGLEFLSVKFETFWSLDYSLCMETDQLAHIENCWNKSSDNTIWSKHQNYLNKTLTAIPQL